MRSTNEAAKQEAGTGGVAAKVSREEDGVEVGRELSRAGGRRADAQRRSRGPTDRVCLAGSQHKQIRRRLPDYHTTESLGAVSRRRVSLVPTGQLGRYHRRHPAMDTLRSNSAAAHNQPSSGQPAGAGFLSPRQVSDELKKFIQASEQPPTTHGPAAGSGLSDAGFILLRLKDQLLASEQHGFTINFPAEFSSRTYNGVELLIRVVVVLQGVVNSVGNASRISNLLARSNSSSNRKRKAAVAEADCIECIKLLLEKTHSGWRSILEYPGNLEVILYSINSPQLDSKCYALEIVILLLEQPAGFVFLLRSLTFMSGRVREETRFNIFVQQLKHGLHTSKLHIQILVVRLLNKLVSSAPNMNFRILAQIESEMSGFSPEYVEKIVNDAPTQLSGVDSLMTELRTWRNAYIPLSALQRNAALSYPTANIYNPPSQVSISQNPVYGYSYSETESDTARSEHGRRLRNGKFSTQTTVAKNVERQRLKRLPTADSPRTSVAPPIVGSSLYNPFPYAEKEPAPSSTYYPSDRALTLTKSWEAVHNPIVDRQAHQGYPLTRVNRDQQLDRKASEAPMRRAKSESTVFISDYPEDNEEQTTTYTRGGGLKRMQTLPETVSDYHPIEPRRRFGPPVGVSRSSHDISRAGQEPQFLERTIIQRPNGAVLRPGSSATIERGSARPLYSRPISPRHGMQNEAPGRFPASQIQQLQQLQQQQQQAQAQTLHQPIHRAPTVLPRASTPKAFNPNLIDAQVIGPSPAPRAHFADPPEMPPKPSEKGVRMQGFSYLFPTQPVLNNIPVKRANTPDPYSSRPPMASQLVRPPSAPIFDRPLSPESRRSPMPTSSMSTAYNTQTRPDGEVVYIPINLEGTNTVLRRANRSLAPTPIPSTFSRGPPSSVGVGSTMGTSRPLPYSRRRTEPMHQPEGSERYSITTDSRSSSPSKMRGPGSVSYSTTYGDDVKDALSQFDYLNDYEGTSSRGSRYGGGNNATYHF
uniref:Uncharacterized protein n=1 Tax=Plectus sambesii TaxID=2011161 RepID=A0A914VAM2_9BILA